MKKSFKAGVLALLVCLGVMSLSLPASAKVYGHPNISINPTNNLEQGSSVIVFADYEHGVDKLIYRVNNGTPVTVDGRCASCRLDEAGDCKIWVRAECHTPGEQTWSWRIFNIKVQPKTTHIGHSSDTTAPTLTVNPFSGIVAAGSTIHATATDDSGINHIVYVWDDGNIDKPIYGSSAPITAPTTPGVHKLFIYVKDNSPNYNSTGWHRYIFTVY